MLDRIASFLSRRHCCLALVRSATADDAGDKKAAAERRQAAEERAKIDFEMRQAALEAALRARQVRRGVVFDEPEEVFVDEDFGDLLPGQRLAAQSAAAFFENSVFGGQGSRDDAARKLEKILQSKVEAVDRGCKLTDSQRSRLVLAGRGDIQHLFDRVDERRRQFLGPAGKADVLFLDQMQIQGLRPLLSTGPFDGNSLFAEFLHSMLTAEQLSSLTAMTEIERLGGRVTRRTQGGAAVSEVHLTATALSDEGLAKTTELPNLRLLTLEITRVTDAGLVHVAGLKSLEVLDLCGTRITGDGLVHLSELHNLQILLLRNTRVNDASLVHLSGLAGLKELHLQGTQVTDAGLSHLVPLQRLELLNLGRIRVTDAGLMQFDLPAHAALKELGLAHTGITDAGLAQIRVLTELERLYVNGTHITDTGLAELGGMRHLKGLYLDDTQISDAGCAHLAALTELEHLDLGGTRVGDVGLEQIRRLKKLKHLDLANTLVTNAGVAELQRALPDVVVIR